jgi:hypothetical protein
MLHRGDVVSLSVPPMWFEVCSITSALVHTYAAPATARLLAGAGNPPDLAAGRLAQTRAWARQTIRPGALPREGELLRHDRRPQPHVVQGQPFTGLQDLALAARSNPGCCAPPAAAPAALPFAG